MDGQLRCHRKRTPSAAGQSSATFAQRHLGIAVGMATDIPPHNVSEIVDATIKLIEEPESTTEDLLEFVKGPDFPTGGIIYDWNAIKQTYATGKGPIVMRAKTEIIEEKGATGLSSSTKFLIA
jgi:DNA gyrase/topoisomerase IV subunit A